LTFLANTVQITELRVPGCSTRKVSLQGAFVTQDCSPREGVLVIFSSELSGCYGSTNGVRIYSNRWFHGVPAELHRTDIPWSCYATPQFQTLLKEFAEVLNKNQCVISKMNPMAVRALAPRQLTLLPKGELRIKANKKLSKKRPPKKDQ
jgi:hypothetical protein